MGLTVVSPEEMEENLTAGTGKMAILRKTRGNYEGAPRYEASRNMSLKTPPAVTSAPAPGPRTMSGCFSYLSVVKAIMLSDPES